MEGGERERKDVALYSESGSGSVAGIVNVLSVLCSCTSSVRTERENLGCVHLSQGLEHATAWMRPIRIIDAGPSIRYTSVSSFGFASLRVRRSLASRAKRGVGRARVVG